MLRTFITIARHLNSKFICRFILLFLLIIGGKALNAQTTRYWVGGGITANFNDGTRWSLTSGGTTIGGTIGWGATDIAIFDGNSGNPTVTLTASITIGKLHITGSNTLTVVTTTGGNWILSISSATSDALRIVSGATLIIGGEATNNRSATIQLSNNAGTKADISGTVKTINSGTTGGVLYKAGANAEIIFKSGSTYEHARNSGYVPPSTWNTGSTCIITGITSDSDMPSFNQSFYNFTWNCPSLAGNFNLRAYLQVIHGDFNLISTGGANSILLGNGNFNITIDGNFNTSGGILNMANWAVNVNILLSGNFNQSGGTITESSTGSGNIIFQKAGTQTFTKTAGTISNTINFTINSGSTLDMGNSVATGTGTFTVSNGGTLQTANTDGIVASADASPSRGSVQTTIRTFNTGANYSYNGTSGQFTGSGLPATVNNLTINNPSGVSLTSALTVNGILTLTSGPLTIDGHNLTIGATGSIAGSFGNNSLILTEGTGALIKQGTTLANFAMVYPVGTTGKYTPMEISGTLGGSVTGTGSLSVKAVAANHPSAATGTLALSKYWEVRTTNLTLNAGNAGFTYHASEALSDPTAFTAMQYSGGSWLFPSTAIVPPTFTASLSSTINGDWTATARLTMYTYQTGNWNDASTWTTDPSGNELTGSRVPQNGDKVIILTDKEVSLTADVATTNHNVTVAQGGTLNLGNYRFTNSLAGLDGSGTIRTAYVNAGTGYFPSVITNTFVNVGGGTYEYYCASAFNLPAQNTYNNLKINNSAGIIATQTANLTINGNLSIDRGTFQINNTTAQILNLTVFGNVNIAANGSITTGTGNTGTAVVAPYHSNAHQFTIYGDFTNAGIVKFTNQTIPDYANFPANGFVTVRFTGATDNTATLNNTSWFYNLIIDKGSDKSNIMEINANNANNFILFGKNDVGRNEGAPYSTENPEVRKALWIKTGTLKLAGKINIPTLSEGNTVSGNGDYAIGANGKLWIASSDVWVYSTASAAAEVPTGAAGVNTGSSNQALSLYGSFQMTDGNFSTRNSAGFIFWNTTTTAPDVIIEGGTVDLAVFRSADAGSGKGTYNQSGGTFTVRGDNGSAGEVSNGYPLFGIMDPACSFIMSGGNLVLTDNSGHGNPEGNGLYIASSAGNYDVTGGKISIQLAGNNFDINSTASLWNVDMLRTSGTVTVNLLKDLTIGGSLLIGDNTTLASNNFNVTVGQNFTLGQTAGTNTAVYIQGTNTTTFNGSSNSSITVTNTGTASPLTFNNLTINKDVSSATVTFASAGRAANSTVSTVNSLFSVNSGILDYATFYLRANGNIYNAGTIGPNASAGRLYLNGAALQTITTSLLTTHSIGHLDINNTNGTAGFVATQLLGDETVNKLTMTSNHVFDIGASCLTIGAAGITAGTFNASRNIRSNGFASAGGLKRYIDNTYNGQTVLFPLGSRGGPLATAFAYFPARTYIGTVTTPGYVTIIPVADYHPSCDPAKLTDALDFYWKSKTTNLVVAGNNHLEFDYRVNIPNSSNDPYYLIGLTWGTAGGNNNSPTLIMPTAIGIPTGDYTSGKNSPFRNPTTFYSRQTGNWNTFAGGLYTTWSKDQTNKHAGAASNTLPQPYDNIVIGDGATYNHTVTVPAGYNVNVAIGIINSGSTLDFGTRTNAAVQTMEVVSGLGKIRISSSAATAVFPTGDFGAFLGSSGGTVEYYSTDPQDFDLPTNITSYKNLTFTPSTGRWIAIPNIDARVYGNFTVQGVGTGSGWGNWYATTRNFTIDGDFNVTSGYFHVYNNVQQNLVVQGNLNISSGASFDGLWNVGVGTPSTHSLTLYGNLTNNGTIDINTWNKINITFAGSNNNSFTGTNGAATTILNNVTINKGISQATTLTFSTAGSISVPTTNWLTLQNGSFIIDNTTINIPISNGSVDFSIPATTALIVRNGKATINASAGTKGIYLDGLLKLENASQLLVGDSTSVNGQYIEYSTSGNAQIDISGTSLLSVNSQIRRSTISTNGSLSYNQTGGSVRIQGLGATTTRAKFEICNPGSQFVQTGGTLNIIRGSGGSTYGDVYIRPASSSTTGGTIAFTPNSSSATAETYKLDANVALYNVYVTGISGHTASTLLNINPLTLNGNLNINSNGSFNTNNLNLTLKGDFVNSGSFSSGTTDVTTFNGSAQKLYGNNTYSTAFNKLTISSSTSLTLQTTSNITINKDLNLLSGTLDDGGNTITVKGNFANYTSHVSSAGTGGIKFAGTSNQIISGDGTTNPAIFGRVEIDNSADVKLNQDVQINNLLKLTNGSVNLDDQLLTINNGASLNAPAGYSLTRMLYTNGRITTSQGVKMYIPTGLSLTTAPVGVLGKYTPVQLTTTTNTGGGSYVIFNPIDIPHPTAVDPANVLHYYWIITSSGLTGFTGALQFKYANSDVQVTSPNTEADYISGRLFSNSWTKLPNTYVDETVDTIQYPFSSATTSISGDYSAGIDAALPTNVPVYYSTGDGNWDTPASWTPLPPSGVPSGAVMVIQNGHTISINTNSKVAYKTTIYGKVDIASGSVGHYFGIVSGTGTLAVTSNTASVKIPAGNYSSFFACTGGALEYNGTGSYILSNIPTIIRNLIINGSGTKTLPNKNITICELLAINNTANLDNSANNIDMVVNGNMTRAATAAFTSGTGKVTFSGVTAQTIGDFSGTNAFNNITVNNSAGITLQGPVHMNGDLTLTQGVVTTTSTNILYMAGGSSNILPTTPANTAYISGPLKKHIIGGNVFTFQIGKGTRLGKFGVRLTNDGDWTAEYFNTGKTGLGTPSFLGNLTAASTSEYWSLTAPAAGNQTFITTRWDNESDVRPAITQSSPALTDMRIGDLNATNQWTEVVPQTYTGDLNNGTQTNYNLTKVTIPASGTGYYTNACINPVKPRARISNTSTICAGSTIPVEFTGSGATSYTISYSINGVDQTDITGISSSTTTITASTAGTYLLNGFTYNNPASPTAGLFDNTTVTVNAQPTTATAGADQIGVGMCGITSATLNGNNPAIGTGIWTIQSGTGGVLNNANLRNTTFSGSAGTTYTLRWTVSNTCSSNFDEVNIEFRALPPVSLTSSDPDNVFCEGTSLTFAANPNNVGNTYNFRVGDGITQVSQYTASNSWVTTGITNNKVVDVVVTNNGCTTTSVGITNTVHTNPATTLGANPSVIRGTTAASLSYTVTADAPNRYNLDFDATAEGQSFADITNNALPVSPLSIVVPAAAGPAIYNANLTFVNSATTCSSPVYPITVTVVPPSSVAMTATTATTICLGETVTLRFTLTGTSPWSITYNGTTVNGILTSPHDIIVSPSPVGTVNYTVTAVSDASLFAGTIVAPATIAVTVNPKPGPGPMYRLPNQ